MATWSIHRQGAQMRDPLFLAQLGFATAAIGIIVAVTLQKTVRDPRLPVTALLLSVGVIPALIGVSLATSFHYDLANVWLGRVSTLLLVVALGAGIFQATASGITSVRQGRDLWLAAMAFSLTALVSEFVNGEFGPRSWVPVLGFTATYLALAHPQWLLTQAKRVAGLFVVGSAIAALVAPMAWTPYDASWIGMDERLQALFRHPNSLGPAMLLYLILERAQPSRSWIRWSVGSTAFVLFILAQSKTAWAAGLLVAAIFWAGQSRRNMWPRLAVAGLVGVALVASVMLTDDAAELEAVDAEQLDTMRTLTGRTHVWAYGLEAWQRSPVTGGGWRVFNDFAERTGQEWAGQAHNQYVQTLGRYGLLGLAGLLTYVVVLVRYGLRHAPATRYTSLALVGVALTRSITESALDGFGFEVFIVFALLLAWERASALEDDESLEAHAASPGRLPVPR